MSVWWCEVHQVNAIEDLDNCWKRQWIMDIGGVSELCRMVEKLLVDPTVVLAPGHYYFSDEPALFLRRNADGQWPRWAKLLAEDWARNFIDEFCDADDLFDHLAKLDGPS